MYLFFQEIKEIFFKEKERWFVFIPALFASGIGIYFSLGFEPSIWISLAVIETLIALAIVFRFHLGVLYFLFASSIPVAGFSYVQLKAVSLSKETGVLPAEKMYVSAKVADMDYNFRGKPRLVLDEIKDFDENKIKGKIRVVLRDKKTDIKIGDCVETAVELNKPFAPSIVGGYQFSRKMFFEGITWMGFPLAEVVKTECARPTPVMSAIRLKIFMIREKIVERINKVLPKDEAGVAGAIVAGQRGLIGEKVYDNYRDSGLAHFLSISGLHMSMIAGLMFFLARFIVVLIPPAAIRYDSKKIAAVFAILTSFLYLLISGAEVPAKRAFIMTTIVLAGVLCSRQAISMKTIAWAALLVLLISPEALVGPSFQMSFAAVICLIAFYEKYAVSIHHILNRGGWFRIVLLYIGGILISDLVASLATLPFAVYHFNRVAVYTTLGNLSAGPIIGLIIMPFVLIALLLMPFGLEALPLKIVGFGVGMVNDITAYVSEMNGASRQIVSMPAWGLALIAIGGAWVCIWKTRWRVFGFIGIVLGMLSICLVRTPDVVIGDEQGLAGVKDNEGDLVILPVRGLNFDKKIWLEKTASRPLSKKETAELKKIYKGEKVDKDWIDLECDELKCVYKGLVLNKKNLGEARSIWIGRDGKNKVITVDEYVGDRFWK